MPAAGTGLGRAEAASAELLGSAHATARSAVACPLARRGDVHALTEPAWPLQVQRAMQCRPRWATLDVELLALGELLAELVAVRCSVAGAAT